MTVIVLRSRSFLEASAKLLECYLSQLALLSCIKKGCRDRYIGPAGILNALLRRVHLSASLHLFTIYRRKTIFLCHKLYIDTYSRFGKNEGCCQSKEVDCRMPAGKERPTCVVQHNRKDQKGLTHDSEGSRGASNEEKEKGACCTEVCQQP